MQMGINATNSIGSEDTEKTAIIIQLLTPKTYALYAHGANEIKTITRLKNMDAVNTQYTVDKTKSKKK